MLFAFHGMKNLKLKHVEKIVSRLHADLSGGFWHLFTKSRLAVDEWGEERNLNSLVNPINAQFPLLSLSLIPLEFPPLLPII